MYSEKVIIKHVLSLQVYPVTVGDLHLHWSTVFTSSSILEKDKELPFNPKAAALCELVNAD